MPINFDPNSLNNVFDKNFGAGSYQAGLSNAANAAKLKQQAALAKSDFLKRLSAAQAKAKQDQAYMDKYGMTKDQYDAKKQQDAINKLQDKYQVLDNGLTSDQASKMRAKGDAEGRGGHQPSYDQQRKEAQQSDKNSSDLTSYDTSKMTPHNQELVQKLQDQQLKTQQAQQQKKTSNSTKKSNGVGNPILDALSLRGPLSWLDQHVVQPVEKNVLDRFATSATDALTFGQLKKNVSKQPSNMTPQFVKDASAPATNNVQKAADIAGMLYGSAAPIGGAYKAASPIVNPLLRALPQAGKLGTASKILGNGLRGGTAMGLYGLANQGADAAINPNDATLGQRAKDVGLTALTGLVGDPLLTGLGTLGRNALAMRGKVTGELPTAFNGKVSQSALDALNPKSSKLKTTAQNPNSNDLFDTLINTAKKPKKNTSNAFEAISQASKKKTPGMTDPNPLDNHGYGLIDLQAEAKAKEPKISPVLQDTARQNTGNADTFNAKISDKPTKDKKSLLENLQTQFVDDAFPAHKYEKAITGQINSAEDSLYKTVRNFRGSPEKAHLIVQEQLAPIFHEMDKAGIKPDDLRNYALAVHAKDVNAKGVNSGFTNAEIKDTIDKFGSPKMEELRKKLVGVNDYAMNLLSSGEKPVLDPQKVADLKKKWPNYMSLFRDMADNKVDFASGVGKSMVNATNPLKKLEGLSADSQLQTINPMESMIKNIFKAVNTADRNNVSAQVAKLAAKDTEGNFIRQIGTGEDTSRLNVINLMDKGKKVQYEVPPDLYKTLKNLDQESTNTLIKILQKPASMLRAGATLTPEFSLRNPLRDIPNAFITSKSGFNPVTDFPVGLMQAIFKGREVKIGNKVFKTPGDLYKQFVKENGGYGNIISMDRQMHQKLLKQALNDHNSHFVDVLDPKTYTSLMKRYANPLNALRNIADISETATKVGEFRAALRSGASPQEAAYRARDTMDFGRAGTSVREANKVVAFLNANIQGKSKLWRAFRENPVRFTGKAVGAVTLPTIGAIIAQNTYANDSQKQIINDAPQWLKDTFYLFPIPGTNQIARIPKPFDLAGAFSNPLERAFDFVAKHDKHAFDSFIKDNLSQASIPVMLTGLAPMVEGMANYSFFKQGPIIPTRESNMNYPDQYDVNTSEVAKGVAKGVNAVTGGQGPFKNFGSPRVIDNTIQGLTGGTGTYVTNAIDWLLNSTGAVKNPEKAAKNIDQQPLAKAFLVNQSSTGQSMDSLYNLKDQLTRVKGSAKQQGQPFTQQGQYNLANQATKQVGDISKKIRSIENSPVMSAEQKRQMLDVLIKQRNNLALQAMQRLNQQ